MNKIIRRLRELTNERVKVKRLGRYPFDINFKVRPRLGQKTGLRMELRLWKQF